VGQQAVDLAEQIDTRLGRDRAAIASRSPALGRA